MSFMMTSLLGLFHHSPVGTCAAGLVGLWGQSRCWAIIVGGRTKLDPLLGLTNAALCAECVPLPATAYCLPGSANAPCETIGLSSSRGGWNLAEGSMFTRKILIKLKNRYMYKKLIVRILVDLDGFPRFYKRSRTWQYVCSTSCYIFLNIYF